MTTSNKIVLTDKQKYVLYQVVQGIREEGLLQSSIGGYAGTGKTELIKYITKFFPNYATCAYTGKAANVLRRKEIPASTIHSLIYTPHYEFGVLLGFDLVARDALGCEGIIVDEASMVSADIYSDLMTYNLPMIFVGDHGQLEPIGSDFNLMKKPDYTLEEIHRNAGDIAMFAERLRKGFNALSFRGSEKVQFKSIRKLKDDDLVNVDQVICAYNKTRVETNARIRSALGFTGLLNVGERIMCLKNNKQLRLFNGMQGIVKNIYEDGRRQYLDFEFDGDMYYGIRYDTKQFGKERPDQEQYIGKDYANPFDYAYCITAHKAQGDEWGRVLVMEQKCQNWDHRRWAYTSASRAKDGLVWAC